MADAKLPAADVGPTSAPPTIGDAVQEVASILGHARIPEARTEARDLVAAVLDVARTWPSFHAAGSLDAAAWQEMRRAARRRASGAPFAYAVGRSAFRHLTLAVDERVLIPRQETEGLVDLVLAAGHTGGLVVDVGTGSGAIALSLAMEGRFERVIGVDTSLDALAVARENVRRLAGTLRSPVELRAGSFLSPVLAERVRAVVANPPYIAFEESTALPASVRNWEPALALYSAAAGMAATHAIIAQAATVLEPQGLLALEVDARRASLVVERLLANGAYTQVRVRLDLAGRERYVLATRV